MFVQNAFHLVLIGHVIYYLYEQFSDVWNTIEASSWYARCITTSKHIDILAIFSSVWFHIMLFPAPVLSVDLNKLFLQVLGLIKLHVMDLNVCVLLFTSNSIQKIIP